MFDIREELPPVEVENPSVQSSQLSPARESEVSTPKAQMRYLIKRGGKQVVRELKSTTCVSQTKKSAHTVT